jgi:hypothetical protein
VDGRVTVLGRETPDGNWDGRSAVDGREAGEEGTRPALGREAPVDGSWVGRETLPVPVDGRVVGRETLPVEGREEDDPLDGLE